MSIKLAPDSAFCKRIRLYVVLYAESNSASNDIIHKGSCGVKIWLGLRLDIINYFLVLSDRFFSYHNYSWKWYYSMQNHFLHIL